MRSRAALPGIPVGAAGTVKEVGRLFVTVEFEDGRTAYYARRQLLSLGPESSGLTPLPSSTVDLGFTATRVPDGSHLCLLPSTSREALEVVASYFAAGLRAGEACYCIAGRAWAARLKVMVAELCELNEVECEGLALADAGEFYGQGASFTADRQLATLDRALRSFEGRRARCFGRVAPVLRGIPAAEWWGYERGATDVLKQHAATGFCGYDLGGLRDEQWQYAQATHPYVVINGTLSLSGRSPAQADTGPG